MGGHDLDLGVAMEAQLKICPQLERSLPDDEPQFEPLPEGFWVNRAGYSDQLDGPVALSGEVVDEVVGAEPLKRADGILVR